jgi:hypothetical protein
MQENLFDLLEFKENQRLVLLYRGSLHGFRASVFHSKCENFSKTLTVIKVTESGNIFGGYTAATWDHIEQYKSDKSAFIFSLVNKEMKPVKVNAAKRRQQNYQN